jgi:uncharacterized membrane protein YfcA
VAFLLHHYFIRTTLPFKLIYETHSSLDMVEYTILAVASFIGFLLSTLGGGGGSLVVMPVINFLFGARAVPPSMTTGTVISSLSRIFIFRKFIDWKLIRWYLPFSIPGAVAGAYASTQVDEQWLEFIIALFLILSVVWYLVEDKVLNFQVHLWHFSLAGLLVSFVSGLVGGTGPMINVLYLKYGNTKEKVVATRAAGEIFVHIVKLASYYYFGIFEGTHLILGLIIGVLAVTANFAGKFMLKKISPSFFKWLTLGIIISSALMMIYQNRSFFE